MKLSVDEWNVWYLSRVPARIEEISWEVAPRISEEAYTAADAVVVGSLLITLLRHADRVTCACLAQLVNTIATIKAEPGGPVWREASFYPFSLTASAARGTALRVALDAPAIPTEKHGEVAVVDAVATVDEERGEAAVLLVNRHLTENADLRLGLTAWRNAAVSDARVIHEGDIHAANTLADPMRVVPRPADCAIAGDGSLAISLPPVSWAVVRLDLAKGGAQQG
jgi:alpha-L-arabinofuranosidase